ncbi:MAG: TPM domain-containing protein [Treponema sp.]|nr:TPM domain-containing protein [Treponema sp.]
MKIKLFLLCLTFILILPASAQDRIVDNAGLLSTYQKQSLINLLTTISTKYNFDLVIVTEINIGNASPRDYADDFFDYNGYGYGQDRDGCLFLQVTDSRDMYISTSGRGISILNDRALNKLSNDIVKHLSGGNNYEAYNIFLLNWEEFLDLDAYSRSYNFFHQWNVLLVIISWALSLLIGLIIVSSWKGQMNTAISKSQAASYMVSDSLEFNEKKDTFLYSTVTKTVRQQQQSSSSGGRTHISSSGRTHGGGGRKY